jgi:hypothetical protein
MRQNISRITRKYCPFLWEGVRACTGVAVFPEVVKRSTILFIHIPKAAGTSICMALYGMPTLGHQKIRDWHSWFPRSSRRITTFSVMRDPVDRFVSAFHFLKKGGITPEDEVFGKEVLGSFRDPDELAEAMRKEEFRKRIFSQIHFIPQVEFLMDNEGGISIDHLLPMERMDLVEGYLSRVLDREVTIPLLNYSESKDLASLGPKNQDFIRDLYCDDCALYASLIATNSEAGNEESRSRTLRV